MCINNILFNIYSPDNLTDIRYNLLHKLEELIPHEKSWYDLASCQNNKIYFFDPISTNMSDQEINDYYERFQTSDYVPWSFSSETPLIYRDSDIISNPLREKTHFYLNWLKPMGVYYGMGSTLVRNNIIYGSITIFRSKNFNDFSDEELLIVDILSQHMSNSLANLFPNGISKAISSQNENSLVEKHHITQREHEVLELICQGLSNQEISEALYISQNTVKKHINNLFHKMNVTTRLQLLNLVFKYK